MGSTVLARQRFHRFLCCERWNGFHFTFNAPPLRSRVAAINPIQDCDAKHQSNFSLFHTSSDRRESNAVSVPLDREPLSIFGQNEVVITDSGSFIFTFPAVAQPFLIVIFSPIFKIGCRLLDHLRITW